MNPDELDAYVRTLVEQAPPLDDQTRERIATLLRSPADAHRDTAAA